MRFYTILVASFFVTATLLIAGCSATNSASPAASDDAQRFSNLKGDAARGRAAFLSTCAACHGQNATGIPGLGKDLTTSEFAKRLADANLIQFITVGRSRTDPSNTTRVDMPPRGGNPALRDQDLADIVAFVRTLQK